MITLKTVETVLPFIKCQTHIVNVTRRRSMYPSRF